MTLPYNPTTEEGRGFLVPIFKAMGHLHIVTTATGYEWPITAEIARSNLAHALDHLGHFDLDTDVLSKQMIKYIKDWRTQINDLRAILQTMENQDPETIVNRESLGEARDTIKTVEQQTWALLSLLDIELLGWPEGATDAGRKP